jgi:uncharacterized protein YqgQ
LKIQNMVDVRKYLSKFGYYIYTGDPLGDLEMIKDEVLELFQANIIDREDYIQIMKVLAKEEKEISSGSL